MVYRFDLEPAGPGVSRWTVALPSDREAQKQAIAGLGELLADYPEQVPAPGSLTLTVTDANGVVVCRLSLSATLEGAVQPRA